MSVLYSIDLDSPKGELTRYDWAWLWWPEDRLGTTFWRTPWGSWYNAADVPLEVIVIVELLGG